MRVGAGAKLDLFHLDDLLLLARFGLAFLGLVFELPEIHDLTDRRVGVRRDFNQIKPRVCGHFHCPVRCDHAYIFAIGANEADFVIADAFIDTRAGVALRGRVMRSAGYGFVPSIVLVLW